MRDTNTIDRCIKLDKYYNNIKNYITRTPKCKHPKPIFLLPSLTHRNVWLDRRNINKLLGLGILSPPI